MIRNFHLADPFTIANGFCGVSAIFETLTFLSTHDTRHLYLAALLIPVALVFDVLDGRVARWQHAASPMGRELDSLEGKVEYFEGTPIPTSIVPLGLLMLAFYGGNLYRMNLLGVEWHMIALLFLVSDSLMISKTLRIPKP